MTNKSCPICQNDMKGNHCSECGFTNPDDSMIVSNYDFEPFDPNKNPNKDFVPLEFYPETESEEIYPQQRNSQSIENNVVDKQEDAIANPTQKKHNISKAISLIVPLILGIIIGLVIMKKIPQTDNIAVETTFVTTTAITNEISAIPIETAITSPEILTSIENEVTIQTENTVETTLLETSETAVAVIDDIPQIVDTPRGNTNANIHNGGLAAILDDWIYYVDATNNKYICKEKIDGTGKVQLNSDVSAYINVVGDWVYYQNQSDAFNIYKIRIDGTDRTKLDEDRCNSLNVIDDLIYYTNSFNNNSIYRMNTDGSEKTQLNKDKSEYLLITDEWIYYCNKNEGSYFYKISLDGLINEQVASNVYYYADIVDNRFFCLKHSFNMIKDRYWTYIHTAEIVNSNPYFTKELYANNCSFMNVVGNWIYYCDLTDDGNIYKMLIDGTEIRQLNDIPSECINIVGDWIYFLSDGDLYRMHLDGSDMGIVE